MELGELVELQKLQILSKSRGHVFSETLPDRDCGVYPYSSRWARTFERLLRRRIK